MENIPYDLRLKGIAQTLDQQLDMADKKGISFELPKTPLEKILVQSASGGPNRCSLSFAALLDIPRSEVCMVDPDFLIRAMFPVRATQIRRPLPHVGGSLSEL